jgi:peptide/nickel transport system substrate-binding protein
VHTSTLRVIKQTSLGYQGITVNLGNKNGLLKGYSNTGTPIASSDKLREAFEMAIDRKAMNKVVFGGTVLPGCTPISPSSAWYDPSVKCTPYNPTQAKKLVQASGVSNPTIHLMATSTSSSQRRARRTTAAIRTRGST